MRQSGHSRDINADAECGLLLLLLTDIGRYVDRVLAQKQQPHNRMLGINSCIDDTSAASTLSYQLAKCLLDLREYSRRLRQIRQQFNPLKRSGVRWLHFEVFSAIQV